MPARCVAFAVSASQAELPEAPPPRFGAASRGVSWHAFYLTRCLPAAIMGAARAAVLLLALLCACAFDVADARAMLAVLRNATAAVPAPAPPAPHAANGLTRGAAAANLAAAEAWLRSAVASSPALAHFADAASLGGQYLALFEADLKAFATGLTGFAVAAVLCPGAALFVAMEHITPAQMVGEMPSLLETPALYVAVCWTPLSIVLDAFAIAFPYGQVDWGNFNGR